jgi:tyrosyl-tRNA synthetase
LRQALAAAPVSAYIGFDATADSLHVGHLQGLMLMRWLQHFGHRPILLIGGATTRIGDPSFRDSSRPMLDEATIAHHIAGIRSAFMRYLRMDASANGAHLVNNADWLDGLGYLEFLNRVGRHFSVNRLLGFDAIRSRLAHSLSFQEFGYTLLQAFDFTELARREGCTLQVGGADQWANIINGVELSRREGGPALFGFTMPLLATSDGRKMGKSAQGAVWLNADRLAPFDFWQFWRNVDDADVARFLALFTELPMDEVRRLGALQGAELNEAKIVLAGEATRLAHGQEAARAAWRAAQGLADGAEAQEGLPTLVLDAARLTAGVTLAELAVEGGLAASRSAARRLAAGGGLRLNGVAVDQAEAALPADGREWRLSAGRKQHVRIVLAG